MSNKKQKLDFVSEEKRQEYLKDIIAFFVDERNEEIGYVAAGEVLDFFLHSIGDDIYKKGISDARKLLKERIEDIEVDLDLLSAKE